MENKNVIRVMDKIVEPKGRKNRLNQLAGAMVITVYFLLGMSIIIVMNDMFSGISTDDATLFLVITLMMLICALFIFAISYYETTINNEIEKETNLRSMLELAETEYQSKLDYVILKNKKAIKNINLFLKEQHSDNYRYNKED